MISVGELLDTVRHRQRVAELAAVHDDGWIVITNLEARWAPGLIDAVMAVGGARTIGRGPLGVVQLVPCSELDHDDEVVA